MPRRGPMSCCWPSRCTIRACRCARYLPSLRRAATSPLAASRMSRAPCKRCSGERTPMTAAEKRPSRPAAETCCRRRSAVRSPAMRSAPGPRRIKPGPRFVWLDKSSRGILAITQSMQSSTENGYSFNRAGRSHRLCDIVQRRRAAQALHVPRAAQGRMSSARGSRMQRQRDRRVVRAIFARGRALHACRRSGAARAQCHGANDGGRN
jgi:hypothetical protein